MRGAPPPSGPPLWLVFFMWLLRMAFLAVLFAWIGRSILLLNGDERDFYNAFQRGLFLVPDTLSLAWQEVLNFTAPLRERLSPEPPLYVGPDVAPPAPPPSATVAMPSFSFTLPPFVARSCLWIAGTQAAVTLWVLIARSDAARMWTSPGALAVLEPRARVLFYGLPLAVAGFAIHRAWPLGIGAALLVAAFTLILRVFPFLTGLPFWIAEEVIGLNFSALRIFSVLTRKNPFRAKPLVPAPDPPRPDIASSLALFGLKPDCTAEDAMQAYRAHLRVNHPAGGGDAEQVKALNAAFEAIKRARGWV